MRCGESVGGDDGQVEDLLAQHRDLMVLVDRVDELCGPKSPDDSPARREELLLLLENIIAKLHTHFDAEGLSLKSDFDDAPDLRAAFEELDQEHPLLLERFNEVLEAARGNAHMQQITQMALYATRRFRDHEAREDSLFLAGRE